jgi:DNA-binding transcriptional LysR family regulator
VVIFMSNSTQPWELDTRHLLALVAIAKTRSVSRAAEELGYGQSAVSQQLASLEKTVGVRLVDRGTGPKPVTLTEPGLALLPHAKWILERLSAARLEIESLDQGNSGSIRIGTFQSAGARLLPRVLAEFRDAWPGITSHIHTELFDGELVMLLRDGGLDVAFVEETSVVAGLDHAHLLVDRFVGVVPPNHRLASKGSLRLSDFADEDMVDGIAGDACTGRAERALRQAGVEPRVVFRTDDNPTRQRLVDAGLGCAVLPGLTVEVGLENGALILPLEEEIARRISIAWSAERTKSRALVAFIETAQRVTAHEISANESGRAKKMRKAAKLAG